jgi:hypothetical protein
VAIVSAGDEGLDLDHRVLNGGEVARVDGVALDDAELKSSTSLSQDLDFGVN